MNKTLIKLLNREITPKECIIDLKINDVNELEELIDASKIPKQIRRRLTIRNVNTMNFLEVREYCNKKIKKGIDLTDLAMELYIKWDDYEISGFDYRYFLESMSIEISKEFIDLAKKIGRFNK